MFGVLLRVISCYGNSEVVLRQNRLFSLLCFPIIRFWSLCFQSLSISICIGFVETRQTWCVPISAFLWDSFLISIMASNAFYAMCSRLRRTFFSASLFRKALLEMGAVWDLVYPKRRGCHWWPQLSFWRVAQKEMQSLCLRIRRNLSKDKMCCQLLLQVIPPAGMQTCRDKICGLLL